MRYSKIRKRLYKLFDPLKLHEKSFIGNEADTGFRIYRRYCDDSKVANENFVPVYSPTMLIKFQNMAFPGQIGLIPKKPNYYSTKSFSHYRLPDFQKFGCEEFLWKKEPFGFHVRSFPKRNKTNSLGRIYYEIEKLLTDLQ